MRIPEALLMGAVFVLATGILGGLWAGGSTTGVAITALNGGKLATITELPQTASLGAKGNSQRIQGVALYSITDIAPGFENSLTLRFYILNPHEMGLAFGSDRTFLELSVTDFSNPNIVYASGTAYREKGTIALLPRGVPEGTTQLKLRGNIVIPGGRAEGVTKPGQEVLNIVLEVALEATQG